MRLHAVLGSTALFVAGSFAIFADDAGHIDYHYALVGFPKQDATLFQQPFAGSKASLIYTLSDKLVIGAVNPKDGELVWRQPLSSVNTTEGYLRAGEDQDTVISAAGDEVTAWSSSDGRYVWGSKFPGSTAKDLEILELPDGKTDKDVKDAIVLLSGGVQGVKRIDGKTGVVRWTYEDASGDSPFQVSSSATSIYYISLHSTLLGGIKLKVTSLDTLTGQKLDQYTLSSESDVSSTESILFAGANSASPLLAWTDKAKKTVKVNILGKKSTTTIAVPSTEDVVKITLHAPHRINSLSHFLVQYDTATSHSAEIYHADPQKNTVVKAYSLPELPGNGAFTTSTSDANVFFTRITTDETVVVSSASHAVLGRWPAKKAALIDNAYPVHGVSEVAFRSGSAQAVRSAVLFSNGQWTLVRNGVLIWARPELLANALTAVWADLPEQEALAHELAIEGHQNVVAAYIHRVTRHIRDLKHLPTYVQGLPAQVVANFAGKSATPTPGEVQQDAFGFHKLVVVATDNGRLVALDAGSGGRIVWSVDFAAAAATLQDPVLRAAHGLIEVNAKGLETPIFVNSTTGAVLSSEVARASQNIALVADELISYDLVDGELKGYLGDAKSSDPIWGFAPSKGERIVGYTARPVVDPVASIGKVLGDRSVLYKYLNPNLVLVTTVVDSTRTASVYLLDSASGNLLHAVSHPNIDTSRAIPSAISEHWFSYSLTLDAATDDTSRGYQLIVAELYESALPNDRGPLGAASNSSSFQPSSASGDAAKPYVISQTYQIPEEISLMTVTQTRQGITSRELLIVLPESNSIVGIPRHVIDPRRPIGRDPTPLEASEGITKYNPALQFDPKWYLNHNLEVIGVKDVITSSALVESTSLVFSYGLDIFGTRVAPSFAFDMLGKGFNKIQMLATVLALGVGVVFVAPLVQRKQINALWQIT
ncbi:DUF1620-domain-containing protein [Mytilinidion resinicola]|uniref:ER membrane protein complex subunit 1 n=1 Tax=Mytilinidion resinicola TaxID=574789 RepID=A0A6A6Y476_9PEZI|nr:DUF1620-domain-containing protein [Mytilinidion resinicola]KAF2803323.1 DUF1620-domain-containing protein [Mytilinidion resinicola]